MEKLPAVNICMITFNHENFIREAIEGVLMQKTSFDSQLIIGEDCSNDNTWEICKEYAKQYPLKIKLLPRLKRNLGMMPNFIRTLAACNSNYVALCEGDDYWIDPLKLQKQVDFLENNREYTFSAHRVYLKENDKIKPRRKSSNYANELSFKYVSQNWFLNTCSFVYKHNFKLDKSNIMNMNTGDRFIAFEALRRGKGFIFDDYMGVYRIHGGGITKNKTTVLKWMESILSDYERYAEELDEKDKNKFEQALNYQRLLVSLFEKKKLLHSLKLPII